MERLEQQIINGIHSLESRIRSFEGKSQDLKGKDIQEMFLNLKTDYEMKKHELMKLFTGLTANNVEATREKYDEIMKGIKI